MAAERFQDAPLWLLLPLLLLAMVIAREFGAWAHGRLRRLDPAAREDAKDSDEGFILSAVLGLLALLVAFCFGMALDRYETRRVLVVTEANALGTAYLRTAVLDDPGELRSLMLRYARARLAFGETGGAAQQGAEMAAARIQPRVWAEAVRLVGPDRQTPLAGFVLSPLNEAFDAASARKAALAARLPDTVVLTLVLYFVAAAAVLGYAVAGAGSRHRAASFLLFALFTLAFGTILDLDRPRSGFIRIPQEPMAETVRTMGG